MDIYDDIGNLMKALAHPVRLQIVQVLEAEGEACVCHLEACLDQRQAYISQQLAKLRQAGLVVDRRDGLNVYYALTRQDLPSLIKSAGRLIHRMSAGDDSSTMLPSLTTAAADCPCPKCETNINSTTA
jgi:ArsR family transcriptional regulator